MMTITVEIDDGYTNSAATALAAGIGYRQFEIVEVSGVGTWLASIIKAANADTLISTLSWGERRRCQLIFKSSTETNVLPFNRVRLAAKRIILGDPALPQSA